MSMLRLSGLVFGCFILAASAQAADNTIPVGIIEPTSGALALDGQSTVNGALLAAQEINAAGGLLGKQIAVLPEDGACNPRQSTNAAEKLLTSDNVVALMVGSCSSATGAVEELALKYSRPLLTGISTAEKLTEEGNPWFFRATTTTTLNGKFLAKTLLDLTKAKKIALIVTSDDWGHSAAPSYGAAFTALGAQVVDTEFFDRSQSDMTEYLTKARAAGADMIFSVGGFQNAANVTVQARQLGFTGPIAGEGAFGSDSWAKLVGSMTGNVLGILQWTPSINNEAGNNFIAGYQKMFKTPPTVYSAAGYNTAAILFAAIKKAGTTDPAKLRDALAETDYTGVMGNFRFDQKGQAYNFNLYLVNWQDGAAKVIATPVVSKQ